MQTIRDSLDSHICANVILLLVRDKSPTQMTMFRLEMCVTSEAKTHDIIDFI